MGVVRVLGLLALAGDEGACFLGAVRRPLLSAFVPVREYPAQAKRARARGRRSEITVLRATVAKARPRT